MELSGYLFDNSFIAFKVSTPAKKLFSSPLASVNVKGSNIVSCGSILCTLTALSYIRSHILNLSSQVNAIAFSSIVRSIIEAPYLFASEHIASNFSSPCSILAEFIIGFPPYTFKAASITSGFIASITKGKEICLT